MISMGHRALPGDGPGVALRRPGTRVAPDAAAVRQPRRRGLVVAVAAEDDLRHHLPPSAAIRSRFCRGVVPRQVDPAAHAERGARVGHALGVVARAGRDHARRPGVGRPAARSGGRRRAPCRTARSAGSSRFSHTWAPSASDSRVFRSRGVVENHPGEPPRGRIHHRRIRQQSPDQSCRGLHPVLGPHPGHPRSRRAARPRPPPRRQISCTRHVPGWCTPCIGVQPGSSSCARHS